MSATNYLLVVKVEKNVSFYEKLGFRGYKTEKLATEETIFVFMEK